MVSDIQSDPRALWSRKLRASGGSMVITIPPAALLLAGLEEEDDLHVSVPEEGTILLREVPDDTDD